MRVDGKGSGERRARQLRRLIAFGVAMWRAKGTECAPPPSVCLIVIIFGVLGLH